MEQCNTCNYQHLGSSLATGTCMKDHYVTDCVRNTCRIWFNCWQYWDRGMPAEGWYKPSHICDVYCVHRPYRCYRSCGTGRWWAVWTELPPQYRHASLWLCRADQDQLHSGLGSGETTPNMPQICTILWWRLFWTSNSCMYQNAHWTGDTFVMLSNKQQLTSTSLRSKLKSWLKIVQNKQWWANSNYI